MHIKVKIDPKEFIENLSPSDIEILEREIFILKNKWKSFTLTDEIKRDLLKLVYEGKRLEAIRILRLLSGWDLNTCYKVLL